MKKLNIKLKNLLIILIVILFIYSYYRFNFIKDIIFVLITSFIIAYSLKPLQRVIVNKFNLNKKIVALILILTLIILVCSFIFILIPKVFKESIAIGAILDGVEEGMNSIINNIRLDNSNIIRVLTEQFTEKFNVFVVNISTKIFDGLIDIGENLIALAVVPVVSYYFLAYSDLLCNRIAFFIPVGKRGIIRKIGKDIDKVLGKYIFGQLILSIIVGGMTFVAMLLLKVKFPLLLSILNALLNIIPYFGAILGIIPSVLVAIISGGVMKAMWVIVAFIIIQQIEGNIIAPQITANSINMHPLTIIILLLIGDKLGGFLGMLLIIPLAVVIKVIYEDIDYYLF